MSSSIPSWAPHQLAGGERLEERYETGGGGVGGGGDGGDNTVGEEAMDLVETGNSALRQEEDLQGAQGGRKSFLYCSTRCSSRSQPSTPQCT